MYRWPLRTDALSCWEPYAAFLVYLAYLALTPGLAATHDGGMNGRLIATNGCYLLLQFITCFFVVGITAGLFEETFRKAPQEYVGTFPLGTAQKVLLRYVRLLAFVLVPYVPTVLVMFTNANISLQEYLSSDHFQAFLLLEPDFGEVPPIPLAVPLVQCAVAVNFYIVATMFLLFLFRDQVLALVVIMAYCALEAAMLHFVFPELVVFRGAFNTPDFYHFFPPNIRLMAGASIVMLACVLLFDRRRRQRTPQCEGPRPSARKSTAGIKTRYTICR